MQDIICFAAAAAAPHRQVQGYLLLRREPDHHRTNPCASLTYLRASVLEITSAVSTIPANTSMFRFGRIPFRHGQVGHVVYSGNISSNSNFLKRSTIRVSSRTAVGGVGIYLACSESKRPLCQSDDDHNDFLSKLKKKIEESGTFSATKIIRGSA